MPIASVRRGAFVSRRQQEAFGGRSFREDAIDGEEGGGQQAGQSLGLGARGVAAVGLEEEEETPRLAIDLAIDLAPERQRPKRRREGKQRCREDGLEALLREEHGLFAVKRREGGSRSVRSTWKERTSCS